MSLVSVSLYLLSVFSLSFNLSFLVVIFLSGILHLSSLQLFPLSTQPRCRFNLSLVSTSLFVHCLVQPWLPPMSSSVAFLVLLIVGCHISFLFEYTSFFDSSLSCLHNGSNFAMLPYNLAPPFE